jgi:hypothetical protein
MFVYFKFGQIMTFNTCLPKYGQSLTALTAHWPKLLNNKLKNQYNMFFEVRPSQGSSRAFTCLGQIKNCCPKLQLPN